LKAFYDMKETKKKEELEKVQHLLFYKEFDNENGDEGIRRERQGSMSEEGVETHEELSTFGKRQQHGDSSEEGVETHQELAAFGQSKQNDGSSSGEGVETHQEL
jgi:hypothetical protein